MIAKLLLAGAAAGALALPALAAPPVSDPPETPSSATSAKPPVDSGPARGGLTSPIQGEAGARTGTAADTAASAADLRAGALVKDAAGLEVGTITGVDRTGQEPMVTLSSGGRTTTVPAASLRNSGGSLVSSATKSEVWTPR